MGLPIIGDPARPVIRVFYRDDKNNDLA